MSLLSSLGTVKRLLAIVLAVAVVVGVGIAIGQAPAIFDSAVDDEPEAYLEFADQYGDGATVDVHNVSLSEGGFVVLTDAGGDVLAVSEPLEAGSHETVTVEADEDEAELLGTVTATAYLDETGDGAFVPLTDADGDGTTEATGADEDADAEADDGDGEVDRPYLVAGHPVSDTATVTLAERPDNDARASLRVESIEGPESASTTDTVEFETEVTNPTGEERREAVEFRVGGTLLERQILELEGDESRELSVEVDLTDVGPGTHVYGVYTEDPGAQGEIDVAFDGPPMLTVSAASPDEVIVDAWLTDDGFVAVLDESDDETGAGDGDGVDGDTLDDDALNGDVVATSDPLDRGVHEAVSIDLEEGDDGNPADNWTGDDATLTAVLAVGDPGDLANATVVTHEGDPVEAGVELED